MHLKDLEKLEGCGVVAHEILTEPRVTMDWLLTKLKRFSNLSAFLDLNGTYSPFSDTVSDKIDFTAYGLHRDHPPPWMFNLWSLEFYLRNACV